MSKRKRKGRQISVVFKVLNVEYIYQKIIDYSAGER